MAGNFQTSDAYEKKCVCGGGGKWGSERVRERGRRRRSIKVICCNK